MLRIPTTLLLGLLLLPLAGQAQTGSQPTKSPPKAPDSGARAAPKAEGPGDLPVVVALDAKECRRLLAQRGMVTAHQPAPDVNYQPGRDVDSKGRPIAPADLPGSNPLPLDGMIELPIRMPLSGLPGLSQVPTAVKEESRLRIATLSVDPLTGKLAFNGKPLEPTTEDAIAVACRDYLTKAQPPKR
ncbi:MAG: hypothetical protein OJJ21_08080 [Ferrovibrio sp.]|uniref:hypothetical protein n=1 Tax=Ferrovibrio sp. TaxID=1917215 RepID=UPI00262C814A|nr:hypothetical protein [Ferrovibrio sp.]MCW0233539.1 hypothetical protein [Ferrovibrio sp.]